MLQSLRNCWLLPQAITFLETEALAYALAVYRSFLSALMWSVG